MESAVVFTAANIYNELKLNEYIGGFVRQRNRQSVSVFLQNRY